MCAMLRSLRTPFVLVTLLIAAFAALPQPTTATAAARAIPSFKLVQVPGLSFDGPVWVGSAPGSGATYYVVEQGGVVWAVTGRTKRRFLDIRSKVLASGEQGLLSIAFATDYARTGHLYAYYVGKDGNGVVSQFTARRGTAATSSAKLVLRVPLSPPDATNHNGGNLWTTPDGNLWLSVGDGGGGGVELKNSQRLGVLMGKLLRVTPRAAGGYTIPAGNPFRTRAGARKEIYALGLRNAWRYSVDSSTGDIWIGDVGQDQHEEVDVLRAGKPAAANFGWPRMEGNALFSDEVALSAGRYTRPVVTYSHSGGRCSITGGIVYRGPIASMRGRYLYADYCTNKIWSVRASDAKDPRTHGAEIGIVHFGEVSGGNVIVASSRTGNLFRMTAR